MAISNRERVGRALDELKNGLFPFLEREMKSYYGDNWPQEVINYLPESYTARKTGISVVQDDVSAMLIIMWEKWNEIFKKTLGHAERNLVSELRTTRNAWAHNDPFSLDDTYRAFDSIIRLLNAVSADTHEVEKQKQEILRLRYEELAKRETRRISEIATEGQPMAGLKPWREIATPHPDVASGRYQQAEFAADLWQVYLDEGSDEYRLPTEFFRRTYLTQGLTNLLSNALLRLSGKGGDPVIELQTNFGGGKTHALLALYHLFFGVPASDLPGIEPIFEATNLKEIPQNVNTVVIVGNKISPGAAQIKPDGTKVKTMWGEIAWQLGGREAYEMVREADETATNPGDVLKHLFNRYGPCLILIDEWVSYARQLHEKPDLPGGTFDTHFTFAQTLSESAKNAKNTLLVVSIPSSEIEIGGEKGKDALEQLKNAIGRIESPWRPASAEESFEIVRRRLFQTTTNSQLFVARDAVIRAFAEMYRNQGQEFPSECREADYERRLREAYPIHPEFFDRLYTDWSSLDKFQRTRGVLRLMAKVIHCLWQREDKSLLIMPAHIPMDNGEVQSELTRYLEDNWVPIIEKDVDGPNSLPLSLDSQNTNLGRFSACRRVTRTIYLGSAPIIGAANLGLEDRRIKLGCTQPGESPGTFGDALRRLTDLATYLYIDGNRYWISNQPNVTRTAQDRTAQYLEEEQHYLLWEEIVRRLKLDKEKGEFAAVHVAPNSSADIADDCNLGVRLVILSPEKPYSKLPQSSPGGDFIEELLHYRGSSPRYYKNTLIFLAPDKKNMEVLEKNIAQYLAWNSIVLDSEVLNLNVSQNKQAISKRDDSDKVLKTILKDTYQWLLVPIQPDAQGALEWQETRLQIAAEESPILKSSRRVVNDEQLITFYSGGRLRLEVLDPYLWREANHVDIKRLWEYMTQYLYLPRLKNSQVLLEAIKEGLALITVEDNFAYAQGWDETKQRYINLITAQHIQPVLDSQSLLVKSEVALQQIEAEKAPSIKSTNPNHESLTGKNEQKVITKYNTDAIPLEPTPPPKPILRRFYGSVDIDSLRVNRDVPAIANEIIQHLTRLNGGSVKITLEIEAIVPDGVPDEVVRTVTENCRTLKFNNQSFEED